MPPRLVAGALLTLLALRMVVLTVQARLPVRPLLLPMVAALLLGACLWWVAYRQVGAGGGSVALGLYVATPLVRLLVLRDLSTLCAALGLFAMVYTAVGVAHALDGPRRKWPRRIALMSALVGFTGLAQLSACAAGLLLSLAAMLYLARERGRILAYLFAGWAGVYGLAAAAAHVIGARGWLAPLLWPAQGRIPRAAQLHGLGPGIGLAAAAALALWCLAGRSRYFGNTAPLLGAVLLGGVGWLPAASGVAWALPFLLLFLAGMFADGFESRGKYLWIALSVGAFALQIAADLHT